MNSDLSQFKLGAKWSIGNSVLKTLVSVFITYLILKKLPVEDYGVFNLIIVIVGYIQLVVIPGLLQIIRRFVPEFVQTKDFYGIHYFTKSYCIKVVAISIFFQVLLYLFSNEIGAFFSILDFWNKIKFLFFFIPFYFVGLIFNQLFNSLLFQKFLAIINFSTEIVRGAIILIMFSIDVALEWVLLAQGITWCLSAVLFIVVYYSKFLKKYKSYFEVKTYDKKRFNDFGLYTYFNEIGAKILNVSTDYFIIGAYLGPLAIGYYAFANKVVTIIGNLLPNRMMKGAITAFFYKLYAKNKSFGALQSRFDLLLKFNLICVAPIVFSILGFGEFFIQYFFQSKYDEAMLILYVLSVFMITKTITHPIGLVLTALEDVKIILYSKLISFVNILFAIILVKSYGAIGVAVATCFSVFLKDSIIFGYARYKYKLTLPLLDLIKIIAVSSFIFIVGYFVVLSTGNLLLVSVSLLVIFALVGYIIVSYSLNHSEFSVLKNMIRKK
jgi:O-antigen/teichoic acid export membrane protein